MIIGSHTIGAYPALIRVECDDGSLFYDSTFGFDDPADFGESYRAITSLMNQGLPLSDGRKIVKAVAITGMDAVRTALTAYYGK